jgi:hypothetical protein
MDGYPDVEARLLISAFEMMKENLFGGKNFLSRGFTTGLKR